MARVLAETLESRERRSLARSLPVRPVTGTGGLLLDRSAGAGMRGFCKAIFACSLLKTYLSASGACGRGWRGLRILACWRRTLVASGQMAFSCSRASCSLWPVAHRPLSMSRA